MIGIQVPVMQAFNLQLNNVEEFYPSYIATSSNI